MPRFDLKEYARRGAAQRVQELQAELADIFRAFPDLRRSRRAASADDGQTPRTRGRKRKRRSMSVSQRKAVSARMKKYWAARRKANSR